MKNVVTFLIHCGWSNTVCFAIPGAREIKALMVRCDNEEDGCEWVGELREFSDHTSECDYASVQCPNKCGETVLRHHLNDHTKSECIMRTVKCPNCGEEGSFIQITDFHPQTCLKAKIPCPRKCGSTIQRRNLDKHADVCPNQEVGCKYKGIGCTVKPLRKDLKKHEDNDKLHLHLALDAIGKLQDNVRTLQNNLSTLRNDVSTLHTQQEGVQVAPCVMKMTDYSLFKSQEKPWHSPPFYTHPGGYKMFLWVYANGFHEGKGTHLSYYVIFMRGKNDDNLSWPFRGEISVKILNQLEDAYHSQFALTYKDRDDASNNRVTEGESAPSGYGTPQSVPQSDLKLNPLLNRHYLKDDCLYFQVSVELPSPAKPWLV